VIFGAVDADVSKTYVEHGLGIAILTTIAFDPHYDRGLRARDASHLFAPSTSYITLRANTYLRKFVYDFIKSVAPSLEPEVVKAALRESKAGQRQQAAAADRP
jgi:LysR family cys regulon transcriptional activator